MLARSDQAPARQQNSWVGMSGALNGQHTPSLNEVRALSEQPALVDWSEKVGCFRLFRDLGIKGEAEGSTFSYDECLSVLRVCGGISKDDRWGFEVVRGSAVFGLLRGGKASGS